ncbi:MAG: flagellar motor protein MotB [Deltaproteobacteria bacterium]|nr:flagellar motor protein MotB [Deltaproteobacteria bacterium]
MAEAARKRRNGDKGPSSSGWEIVYTGFILIMLSFFIMLCSFSTIEKSKVEHFVASFSRALSVLPGGVKVRPGDEARYSLPDITYEQGEVALIFQELLDAVDELGLADDLTVHTVRDGLIVALANKALFELGVAEISEDAFPLLDKIAEIIAKGDYPVEIRGHTDNIPIHTEKFPSNWELSTARAVNVLRYFVKNHDISPERLSAAGFGEFRPVVPNENDKLRAKNRRVEVIFRLSKGNRMGDAGKSEEGFK